MFGLSFAVQITQLQTFSVVFKQYYNELINSFDEPDRLFLQGKISIIKFKLIFLSVVAAPPVEPVTFYRMIRLGLHLIESPYKYGNLSKS